MITYKRDLFVGKQFLLFDFVHHFFNNFLAASVLMFGLVMAFNMFSDALQDALDPRKVS